MPQKKQKSEEIVAKLRQANVLHSQGRSIGVTSSRITGGARSLVA
jgi:hypothetical protein